MVSLVEARCWVLREHASRPEHPIVVMVVFGVWAVRLRSCVIAGSGCWSVWVVWSCSSERSCWSGRVGVGSWVMQGQGWFASNRSRLVLVVPVRRVDPRVGVGGGHGSGPPVL